PLRFFAIGGPRALALPRRRDRVGGRRHARAQGLRRLLAARPVGGRRGRLRRGVRDAVAGADARDGGRRGLRRVGGGRGGARRHRRSGVVRGEHDGDPGRRHRTGDRRGARHRAGGGALITDGRRLKGRLRRRRLLDATMRVIERAGVAAVSQRVVAQEAAVPPSAVTYYFPTVDDLLVAALADCNDAYLQELEACAHAEDPVAALARLIAKGAGAGRAYVA